MEEKFEPVAEAPIQQAVKPAAQTAPPQYGVVESTISSQMASTITTTTTATSATAVMHGPLAPGVVPVEPMPSPIPGVPSPYHAVDFCVPVGPDFNLVTGL